VESQHQEQVASQVLEFILVLLKNGSDAETWCAATIVRKLAVVFKGKLKGVGALSYQVGAHLGHRLNHAKETALDVLEVVAQQLVDILVKVQLNGNHEPLGVHLEEKQVSQQRLAADHDLRVLDQLREGSVEQGFILQGLIEFLVRLGERDI